MKNPYTKITDRITKHLFIAVPCPHCHKEIAVSLNSIYKRAPLLCTECNEKLTLALDNRYLDEFVRGFDGLYAQLRKIGLPLMFFHHPVATIWSRDDKQQDNT